MKRTMLAAGIITVISLFHNPAEAQRITVDVGGGGAVTTGSDIQDLAAGFTLSTDGALALTRNFEVGLRYSFTRWGALRQAFLNSVSANSELVDVNGGVWSMEIAPLLRLDTDFEDNVVNLFADVAAGLYIITNDVTADLLVDGSPVTLERGSGTDAHFGFSLGGGATIGRATPVMLRAFPAWHYVIRDKSPDNYWTFNAALVFGLGSRR